MNSALYIYGLTAGAVALPDNLGAVDAPGEKVECAEFGTVCAIVSPLAPSRPDPIRRHLLAHTRVLEAALAACGVLPMRFGMVVESRERLAGLMRRHTHTILANLKRLDGRIEVGLKASWSPDAVWRRIGKAQPAFAAECARLNKVDPNRAYFDRIEQGRRVAAALADLRVADSARLDALVKPFAGAAKELPTTGDMMFANRALLVSRAAEPALYAAVREFAADGVDARYVAPVPPYNFVDLALSGGNFSAEAA